MICIWLLESKACTNAEVYYKKYFLLIRILSLFLKKFEDALNKFGDRRTNWDKGKTFQGVETPSQSRFVEYYDIIIKNYDGLNPPIRNLKLKKIIIHSIKGINKFY